MKQKEVKLFRVRMGSSGQLPKGYPEGMLVGLSKEEIESLKKNPVLQECFQPIKVVDEFQSLPQEKSS